ncbi:hypothetical protein BBBOND_0203750 [Babesia bigemina]|uniref:Uncharacterized protein n=1 Tax=Babesia bigemina TaxID=5866 RepID=A0A061D5A1_BABBI|nr:hypothetical protein BBBOND_0203750 [Babesia bigemina]CDR95217.1 hypothetical protein BBBOND_0203750 [Babesia bigemina]|eukprot:XP_012767403.1 hypothetical protein BBBOND_0203750 [Babesia bigemina]
MLDNDDTLADREVLGVLRQQLPPQLRNVESVEDLLEYGISVAKAERDKAVKNFLNTKKLMANIKLLERLDDNTRAYIDAGNGIFLPARLKDRRILVHIGYQFYLAMDHDEAYTFASERLKLLQKNIDALNAKVAEQRAQAFIIAETLCTMSAAGIR